MSYGSRGPVVPPTKPRLKQLHFDPGPVDGYFDQDTQYAVIAVQKYFGLPRTGASTRPCSRRSSTSATRPPKPKIEPDRVEIDLDRQVLTFSGLAADPDHHDVDRSGEHFCGGADGCQYAITPAGPLPLLRAHNGWQKGKLGKMWNPYYFNGGIAVHGLASVPAYPASHGCARIPMHIADYFHTLVHQASRCSWSARRSSRAAVTSVPCATTRRRRRRLRRPRSRSSRRRRPHRRPVRRPRSRSRRHRRRSRRHRRRPRINGRGAEARRIEHVLQAPEEDPLVLLDRPRRSPPRRRASAAAAPTVSGCASPGRSVASR